MTGQNTHTLPTQEQEEMLLVSELEDTYKMAVSLMQRHNLQTAVDFLIDEGWNAWTAYDALVDLYITHD